MYAAVEAGIPQQICGDSALAFQEKVDAGAQTVVGVNKYRVPAEEEMEREALKPPPRKKIDAQLKRLKRFKAERNQARGAPARSMRWPAPPRARTRTCTRRWSRPLAPSVTHGEICATLRKVYGFGQPLIVP